MNEDEFCLGLGGEEPSVAGSDCDDFKGLEGLERMGEGLEARRNSSSFSRAAILN